MGWFQVDDKFYAHPKFLRVGMAARGLWVTAGSWCAQNLTDGWLPEEVMPLIALGQDVSDSVADLEGAALWIRGVGGWQFKDWTDWNHPREYHEKRLSRDRERKRKAALARWEKADETPSEAVSDSVRNPSGVRADSYAPNLTQPNHLVVQVDGDVQVAVPTDRRAIKDDERFVKFWRIAVRKSNKGAARKAFTRALTKTSEQHLAAAWIVANQAWATWPQRDVIPHPSTWLNGERWDDDPPQPHTPTSKTLNALDRADQMEMNDDPSRLPATARPSIPARPASDAR